MSSGVGFLAASERLIGSVRVKIVTNKYEISAFFFRKMRRKKIKIHGTNENIFNDRNIF